MPDPTKHGRKQWLASLKAGDPVIVENKVTGHRRLETAQHVHKTEILVGGIAYSRAIGKELQRPGSRWHDRPRCDGVLREPTDEDRALHAAKTAGDDLVDVCRLVTGYRGLYRLPAGDFRERVLAAEKTLAALLNEVKTAEEPLRGDQ